VHFTLKAETHNHPCQVSPFPGAATGVGGELRDEGSIGSTGSTPQAGLAGFITSDLLIPGQRKPWEVDVGFPSHTTSSFGIMMDAPIGAAQYSNEFGRPCVTGFFRTLTATLPDDNGVGEVRGYHKVSSKAITAILYY
jgi:phosphoribosylformylglycinamidine synthase